MEVEMREIVGTDGKYSVTRCGRVWSNRKQIFLQPGEAGKGYQKVSIRRFGEKTKNWYIHRLVAEAFIPNPDNKPTVNHKDGDKTRNCVSNLEWATQKEQARHAVDTGLSEVEGTDNPAAVLNDAKVIEIRTKYSTKQYSHEALAQEYGVTRACILDVVRGRTWTHLPHDETVDTYRWRERGESASAAKLTAAQVREIRIRYAAGGCTHRSLAAEYGVGGQTVTTIVNFKTWAHQDHDLRKPA